MDNSKYKKIYDLLQQLVSETVTGNQKKNISWNVDQFLSNSPYALGTSFSCDEASLIKKITERLSSDRSKKESSSAQKFSSLYDVLKSNYTDQRLRGAMLHFLFILADTPQEGTKSLTSFVSSSNSVPNLVTKNILSSASCSTLNRTYDNASNYHRKVPLMLTQSNDTIKTINGTIKPTMIKNEDEIVQNAIYACTGIEGSYLRKDITGTFRFSNNKSLNVGQAHTLLRLSQLGYHFNMLKAYTDPKGGLCPMGLMGQGFVSAIRNEITQYIGSVALLQDELNQQRELNVQNLSMPSNNKLSSPLTLMKVFVWASPILDHLQWLTIIAEACKEKKGGSLATIIYNFTQHGNTQFSNTARELLLAACAPLYQMLSRWLLEGEINDPHDEFFIECISEVNADRLWYEKYRVRSSMLPIFISTDMAHKILVAGKSINFLCHICGDDQPVKGGNELQECIDNNAEDIFSYVADTKLHTTIDSIYLNTSKRVLDIVKGPHKLLEHLQAMRRYLLLGQGDFINILMINLKEELDKPAKELYSYDLSSMMDTAIRLTNAQYDDPEILNHLDVRLTAPCDGDTGWDILSLQYTIHGPLDTMLNPSMKMYQSLFKSLWRMKHMEYLLSSKIWKEKMCNEKSLRPLKSELRSVFYRLHLITSEMIHFIYQMQYYMLFEVIECSWVELQDRVQQAKSLDDILNAHNEFLETIKRGAFLDSESAKLFQNLDDVYECIIRLEVWLNKFFQICFKEADARKQFELEKIISEEKGTFGVTEESQLRRDQEQKIFQQQLSSYETSLITIGIDYEKAVRCFLLSLNSNNDHNLQGYGIRLDFNEYYKKRDQRLGVPLTFEHMRLSNVFFNKSLITSRISSFN